MRAERSHYPVVVLLLGLGLVASGCATTHSTGDASPAASIATEPASLSGAWYGSSYPIGAASKNYVATLTVRFENDGSWKAVETQATRTRQFSGTSSTHGDQIWLVESTGHYFLKLTRRGDRLYGLYPSAPDYSYPGVMAIEFRRAG